MGWGGVGGGRAFSGADAMGDKARPPAPPAPRIPDSPPPPTRPAGDSLRGRVVHLHTAGFANLGKVQLWRAAAAQLRGRACVEDTIDEITCYDFVPCVHTHAQALTPVHKHARVHVLTYKFDVCTHIGTVTNTGA